MSTQINIPGYAVGTWVIDTARSTVSFQSGFLGMVKIGGTFDEFEGTIVLSENPLDSSVNAVIKTASLNTKNKRRDHDLSKGQYLDVEQYPTITFASTGVRADGENYLLDGDLTIRSVTKQVTLNLQLKDFAGTDDQPVVRFSATTETSNKVFGVTRGIGAATVSDRTTITLDVEATKQG